MRSKDRGERRFKEATKLEQRVRDGYWQQKLNARARGKLKHTPTLCSCWMCGNPRRNKYRTLKECSDLEFIRKVEFKGSEEL